MIYIEVLVITTFSAFYPFLKCLRHKIYQYSKHSWMEDIFQKRRIQEISSILHTTDTTFNQMHISYQNIYYKKWFKAVYSNFILFGKIKWMQVEI